MGSAAVVRALGVHVCGGASASGLLPRLDTALSVKQNSLDSERCHLVVVRRKHLRVVLQAAGVALAAVRRLFASGRRDVQCVELLQLLYNSESRPFVKYCEQHCSKRFLHDKQKRNGKCVREPEASRAHPLHPLRTRTDSVAERVRACQCEEQLAG